MASLSHAARLLFEAAPFELKRAGAAWRRRFGAVGLLVALFIGAAAVAAVALAWQSQRLQAARTTLAALPAVTAASGVAPLAAPRMADFDGLLLPTADIPVVLQSLLTLARAEELVITRGEYRAEPDAPGQFMRYRMALPVKGDAKAVQRFIARALAAHRMLSLDSVQFKRDRIDSPEIEARLQWVLMVRLPVEGSR